MQYSIIKRLVKSKQKGTRMIRKEAVVVKRNYDDVNDDNNYNYAFIKKTEQNE